jgi:hypothetical protein
LIEPLLSPLADAAHDEVRGARATVDVYEKLGRFDYHQVSSGSLVFTRAL